MNKIWSVLQSKTNKEFFLAKQLETMGAEFYLPQLSVCPVNPRSMKTKPYFPGYLFIRVDKDDLNLIKYNRIPGTVGLLYFGDDLAYVSGTIIQEIQTRVPKIAQPGVNNLPGLKKGDPVLVNAGPFADYEGIFNTRISGTERVKVLLNLLQDRQILIDLPEYAICEIKTGYPSAFYS